MNQNLVDVSTRHSGHIALLTSRSSRISNRVLKIATTNQSNIYRANGKFDAFLQGASNEETAH